MWSSLSLEAEPNSGSPVRVQFLDGCSDPLRQQLQALFQNGWLQPETACGIASRTEAGTGTAGTPTGLRLVCAADGLSLLDLSSDPPLRLRLDFRQGRHGFRLQRARQAHEDLWRALGKPAADSLILDATAGLGRDSLILAASGCRVLACERHPLLAALLGDALQRAGQDPLLADLVARIQLVAADAAQIHALLPEAPAGVLFDPMFPERAKTAAVKQEMRVVQQLLGPAADQDAEQTLLHLRRHSAGRVVVKRPRNAPVLGPEQPSGSIQGRSIRFDIYAPLLG